MYKDIKIFGNSSGDVIAAPDFSGTTITGIDLVVQRFLIALLTESNSVEYDYKNDNINYGTLFVASVSAGNYISDDVLRNIFSAAELEAKSQLQAEDDNSNFSDAEKYDKAELGTITIGQDNTTMEIIIYNKAGDSKTVLLPLSICAK